MLVEPAEVAGPQAAESCDRRAGDDDLAVAGDRDADAGSGGPAVSRSPGSATVTVEQACVSP